MIDKLFEQYVFNIKEVDIMATRGNAGRGSRGACGGSRRRDGSGGGVGNRGTSRQPSPRR
jgi:hypothetical protein